MISLILNRNNKKIKKLPNLLHFQLDLMMDYLTLVKFVDPF